MATEASLNLNVHRMIELVVGFSNEDETDERKKNVFILNIYKYIYFTHLHMYLYYTSKSERLPSLTLWLR